MKIEKLKWDSQFFKLRIGKLVIGPRDDVDTDFFLSQAPKHFDLVYVFSFINPLNPNIVLGTKLSLVDIMLTMSRSFSGSEKETTNYEFRQSLNQLELAECYEIAEHTSEVSRFNIEPLIGVKKTKAMYRRWIDNALKQSFSDGVFVHRINGKIVGIHLIKTEAESKTGYFTLTGVHKSYKGKGIGKILWNNSYEYWKANYDIQKIESPFSMQNIGSFNFHLKMGFNRVEQIKYIYHYRNPLLI